MTSELMQGGEVWLPCAIADGMFPTEKYVTVHVPEERDITGFIPVEDVELETEREGRVRAVVHQVVQDRAVLLFRGELLSRTNPVAVSTRWLSKNLYDPRPR